jgi:AAA domain/Bifunctional DNA primase/polymerase, N-terminal
MGAAPHRLEVGLSWTDSLTGDGAKRNSRAGSAAWKNGERLPSDLNAAIAVFKTRARTRNVCVVASRSELVLLETDGPTDELLTKFELQLPETVTVISRRGHHMYFRPDVGMRHAKYQVDETGVTASEDGYLVGAGSLHPTGLIYMYTDPDAEVAVLPAETQRQLDRLAGTHREQVRERVRTGGKVTKGNRRQEVFSHALELFHRGLDADEVFRTMLVFNERHCDPPLTRDLVRDQVRGARRRLERRPRTTDPLEAELEALLNEEIPVGAKTAEPKQKKKGTKPRSEIFLPFESVKAAGPPRWLWRGRVPIGGVTLCAGRPKIGKSLLTVWLAAQLSKGLLPGDFLELPARTLLIAAEDPVDTIVKSRLMAADADQELIGTLASRPSRPSNNSRDLDRGVDGQEHQPPVQLPQENPDGLDGLDGEGALARRVTIPDEYALLERIVVENEIALLVLDPINSFITARIDAHRDVEIRRVLDPLAALTARRGFAALGIVHLNRRSDTDVLNRITGSGGYGGSARSILTFGRHPEDDNQRVVAAEGNWQKEAHSDLFEIREIIVFPDAAPDDQTQPALTHVGTIDLDSSDLIDQLADDRSALDEAKDFLLTELVGGPMAVADLRRGAEANGISWPTLERAKKLLGVQARRISTAGAPRGAGRWEWFLELEEQPEQ